MRTSCQRLLHRMLWLLAPLLASTAMAQPPDSEPLGGTFSAYGEVLKVTPIVRRQPVVEPYEQCRVVRDARQTRYSPHQRRRVEPPHRVLRTVVGSLIGGAVGNQFGGGRGKDALTVLGAIAGARIANRPRHHAYDDSEFVYRRYPDSHEEPISVEQCTQTERTRYVEQITGYRVRYRYNGETYTKTTSEHPGKRIPLEVRVTPRIKPSR